MTAAGTIHGSHKVRRGLCCAGLQKQSPIAPWSEATRQPAPELPGSPLHIVAMPWDNSGMRIAVMGSGAVGGYYGARLALAGHDVTFIARGAHLDAIRAQGLQVRSPALGDFTARAPAEQDTAEVGPVDLVLFAVKAYDNSTAIRTRSTGPTSA